MHTSNPEDYIDGFTLELLRSGVALADLTGDLIDALPADAYPDEGPAEAVLQMISGTIRTFLAEARPDDVELATEMMAGALDRVIEHLRLALALRQRMEAGERHDDGGQTV
jgi:hypothetical protein